MPQPTEYEASLRARLWKRWLHEGRASDVAPEIAAAAARTRGETRTLRRGRSDVAIGIDASGGSGCGVVEWFTGASGVAGEGSSVRYLERFERHPWYRTALA